MGKSKKKRLVKALVVKAEKTIQKVGSIQICAPMGVRIDPKTGELKTSVELKLLGLPVFTPTVLSCKLINHGLQKACLVVQKSRRSSCDFSVLAKVDLDIPIFSMHDIAHIQPGDQVQEQAEVESIDIRGIRDPKSQGCGDQTQLIIKVIYKVKVTIVREETVCIPEHCDHKGRQCSIKETGFDETFVNENNINIVVSPFWQGSQKFI